jgi:hypothetical protein
MTATEAKKLGTKEGKDRGERIWTETSSQRLPEVAEKFRHRKAWESLAAGDLGELFYESKDSKFDKRKGRWDTTRTKIPSEHHATFKKAYIAAGMKIIEENVQDAIKSGWLQDV